MERLWKSQPSGLLADDGQAYAIEGLYFYRTPSATQDRSAANAEEPTLPRALGSREVGSGVLRGVIEHVDRHGRTRRRRAASRSIADASSSTIRPMNKRKNPARNHRSVRPRRRAILPASRPKMVEAVRPMSQS